MNWVGGSRSRLMVKDDMKRQREFFEKKKLQQRLKNLGLPLPNSSETCTSGSMDLVTLFIVNQIAAKKEKKDPPKVSVLSGGSRAVSKRRRHEPLMLPMSPCSPSQLSLVESQAHEHWLTRKRKHVTKLSPVLESAFSDNSASDYAPHATETLSPFSTSSASSAQGGIFGIQLNQQQNGESQAEPVTFCSQAWGGSRPEHDLFQAFSQPRDTINPRARPCPPDLSQLETPSAAQVLFGSPSSLETEGDVNPVVGAILRDPLDDNVPVLDFHLNQHEYEEPFDEDVFRGFSSEDFTAQVNESGKCKIHLRSELFHLMKPQMVPETMCSELSSCANTSFFCPGNSSAILDKCLYSPQCFTSDSSEDEDESCAQARLKTSAPTESNQRSLGTLEQLCPFPPLKRRLKIREEVSTCLKELNTENNQQSSSHSTPDFLSSLAQTQCLECLKKRIETRETGTQTENPDTADKCETAVQCSLMQAPVEASVQLLSTRGQTEHAEDRKRHAPGISARENRQEHWSRMMLRENSHEDKVSPQSEGKQREDEVKGAIGNTADAQTLQGIANILLLLKQGRHGAA